MKLCHANTLIALTLSLPNSKYQFSALFSILYIAYNFGFDNMESNQALSLSLNMY